MVAWWVVLKLLANNFQCSKFVTIFICNYIIILSVKKETIKWNEDTSGAISFEERECKTNCLQKG